MNSKSIILSLSLLLSFGSAIAKVDEVDLGYYSPPPIAEPEANTSSLPETKDQFYAPQADPEPEPPSCATPRDGLDSKDEGERVMCAHSAPPPAESDPKQP